MKIGRHRLVRKIGRWEAKEGTAGSDGGAQRTDTEDENDGGKRRKGGKEGGERVTGRTEHSDG